MNSLLRVSVVGFAAALLASSPLIAASHMTESLRPLKGDAFEMSFLSQMIEHHKEGIAMAKLVPHNTKRAELTKFAEKMSKMQEKENGKMAELLKSGGHGDGHATMNHGDKKMHHGKVGDKTMDHSKMDGTKTDHAKMAGMKMDGMKMPGMAELESAQGAAFDRAFVQHMIMHHTMAVEMAQLAKGRATRPEVLQLAAKIVKDQKDEIKTLQGWQAKWAK